MKEKVPIERAVALTFLQERCRVLLELREIGKVWSIRRTGETVVALQAITLDVRLGEFLILLGPSGCGKSTLLQIIAGLEKPSSGEISFPSITARRSSPVWSSRSTRCFGGVPSPRTSASVPKCAKGAAR